MCKLKSHDYCMISVHHGFTTTPDPLIAIKAGIYIAYNKLKYDFQQNTQLFESLCMALKLEET